MPSVFIQNLGKILEVGETTRNLLVILQEHRMDWMHAREGKGRCATFKTIVVDGLSSFKATPAEKRYHEKGALECKLPHVTYLD